jgi:hypothetical protein
MQTSFLTFSCFIFIHFSVVSSSEDSSIKPITTPDATECAMNQQWTAPTNYLCGKGTGLGCEFAKYSEGLPVEVSFEDENKTIIKACNNNGKLTTFIVPYKDTGDIISSPLNFTCKSKGKVYVKINSPCFQNKKFRYGVQEEGELTFECGIPDGGRQKLAVSITSDHYKFGEDLGAHTRAVLNIHTVKCSFAGEGILKISGGSRLLVYNVWMLSMAIIINFSYRH